MLHSLAVNEHFPKWFAKLHKKHRTPNNAVFVSSLVLFLGAILSLVSLQAFIILASISGFGFIFTWLMIALSQRKLRSKYEQENKLKYRAPFSKIIQPFTVIYLVLVLVGQLFSEDGRISLMAGVGWLIFASIYYAITSKNR